MDKRTTKARRAINPNDRAMAHGTRAISRATLSRITSLSPFHRFLLLNHDMILDAAEGRKIDWKGFLAQPEIAALDLRDGNGNRISEGRASRIWWEVRKYYETHNQPQIVDTKSGERPIVETRFSNAGESRSGTAGGQTGNPVVRSAAVVPVGPTGTRPSTEAVAEVELLPSIEQTLDQLAAMEFKRHGVRPNKLIKDIRAEIAAISQKSDQDPPKN